MTDLDTDRNPDPILRQTQNPRLG